MTPTNTSNTNSSAPKPSSGRASKPAVQQRAFASLGSFLSGSSERPTLKTQLAQAYGRTRRGGPNTKAAAIDLGVSQRTVQRWVKNGKLPASDRGRQTAEKLQAWRTSPQGRQAVMGAQRAKRLSQGFKVRVSGTFTISEDRRPRRDVFIDVPPEHAEGMVNAYINGDDAEAQGYLNEAASTAFGGSVEVRINSLRFAN